MKSLLTLESERYTANFVTEREFVHVPWLLYFLVEQCVKKGRRLGHDMLADSCENLNVW